MTDHTELQHDIVAYVAGQLDAEARQRLHVHLVDCRECEQLLALCEQMAVEIHHEKSATAEPHPSPLELRSRVEAGAGSAGDSIDSHIGRCPTCALEVEMWRRWHSRCEAGPGRRKLPWLGLAASFLLGALVSLPLSQVIWKASRPEEAAQPWSGSAEWLLLDDGVRSATGPHRLEIASDQPLVPIGVVVAQEVGADRSIGFAIADQAGELRWETHLPSDSIREQVSRTGFVMFLVPVESLPAGRYRFTVDVDPPLEIPFEVGSQRQSPEATKPAQ